MSKVPKALFSHPVIKSGWFLSFQDAHSTPDLPLEALNTRGSAEPMVFQFFPSDANRPNDFQPINGAKETGKRVKTR